MRDINLQNPIITQTEIDGWTAGDVPRCPICGAETDTFYLDRRARAVIGCAECMCAVDAWDYEEGRT